MHTRLLLSIIAVLAALAAQSASAQQAVTIVPQSAVQPAQTLMLPLNKSQVLKVSEPVTRIAVGKPDIVDAVALNDRSFYVLGKGLGATNISVYGANARLLAVIDAVVSTDLSALKAALHDAMPDEVIEVRGVNESVALGGVVASSSKVSQALDVARSFAGKDNVINHLSVTGAQQVMLQVKVAEMSRTVSKSLGFKPMVNNTDASGFSLTALDPVALTNYALAVGRVVSGNYTMSLALDALEQRGAVKILAEPNLVAMSGDTASFLAGGEFPIPVAQSPGLIGGAPTITIEFKPFGVSLAFTPTVVTADLVNLVVAPEVSELDKVNAITLNGTVIPGIATRRARTTVEVRDGQSFAIAGLLQSNFRDQVRGIPGISSIPVLGALLRSSEFQRDETELVIIVTPRLVRPAPPAVLVAPTDSFVPPSEAELFLLGRTENAGSAATRPQGGGLTGKFGHIIR